MRHLPSLVLLALAPAAWSQRQLLEAPDGMPFDDFGYALASDGDTLVVGAPLVDLTRNNGGAFYAFERTPSGWELAQEVLPPVISGPRRHFGWALGLEGDDLFVGWPLVDGDRGGVARFRRDGAGTWQYVELYRGDTRLDRLGTRVAVDGDWAAFGAPGTSDFNGFWPGGKVHLHQRDAGGSEAWGRVQTLDLGGLCDWFGYVLALEGELLVAGSLPIFEDCFFQTKEPQLLVYRLRSGSWVETARLHEDLAALGYGIGTEVAVSGGRILLRAFRPPRTEVLLLEEGAGGWEVVHAFDDPSAGGIEFGSGLDLDGPRVAIGSPREGRRREGSVRLYRRDEGGPGAWGLARVLRAPDGPSDVGFGEILELMPRGVAISLWDVGPGSVLVQDGWDRVLGVPLGPLFGWRR